MRKYKFTNSERFAIFLVHGKTCYLCNIPLNMEIMTVDHVIPEYLLSSPTTLDAKKHELGLHKTFNLNSFENWLPACASCNRKKATEIFEPAPIFQLILQKLKKKAPQVKKISEDLLSKEKASMALLTLEKVVENIETLDPFLVKQLHSLAIFATERAFLRPGETLRLTNKINLKTTTIAEAEQWGVTHWTMPLVEPHQPPLVVLLQLKEGNCSDCDMDGEVFQAINQEGGADPICRACLSDLEWMTPVVLGSLPTHITNDSID